MWLYTLTACQVSSRVLQIAGGDEGVCEHGGELITTKCCHVNMELYNTCTSLLRYNKTPFLIAIILVCIRILSCLKSAMTTIQWVKTKQNKSK